VCPTEIIAFSDRIKEFRAINTEVVAVSTDSHFSHLGWIKTARKVSHSVLFARVHNYAPYVTIGIIFHKRPTRNKSTWPSAW